MIFFLTTHMKDCADNLQRCWNQHLVGSQLCQGFENITWTFRYIYLAFFKVLT